MTFSTKKGLHRQTALDRFGKSCIIFTSNGDNILIRLPNYTHDEINMLLHNNHDENSFANRLWHKIQCVHDQLLAESRMNSVDLYPRFWKSTSFTRSSTANDCRRSFTAATFNTLARGLSSGPNSIFPPPFLPRNGDNNSSSDGNCYGGFTHLSCPEIVLDYELRKWRLVHVLLGGGLSEKLCEFDKGAVFDVMTGKSDNDKAILPFDIVALQEVDDYYSFWRPLLVCDASKQSLYGNAVDAVINRYQGVFEPKPRSPCVGLGWYSDGVALLWNGDKFRTVARPETESADPVNAAFDYFKDMGSFEGNASPKEISAHDPARKAARNQVYIIVPLQRIGTDQVVIAATTHLKAKKGYMNERIRHLQALELRSRVNRMANVLHSNGWRNINAILLGDFNSEPNDASVQCVLEPNGSHLCTMQSAYNLHDPNLYTTWKARKEGSVCRTIDYIFYSNAPYYQGSNTDNNKSEETTISRLECKKVLAVPEKESVDELLPGFRYPSDHLLMAAEFDWA
jgi:endonuclease/exonuclease/phosphatase family metal-dependent hydrolase